jgi:hypothetical protein
VSALAERIDRQVSQSGARVLVLAGEEQSRKLLLNNLGARATGIATEVEHSGLRPEGTTTRSPRPSPRPRARPPPGNGTRCSTDSTSSQDGRTGRWPEAYRRCWPRCGLSSWIRSPLPVGPLGFRRTLVSVQQGTRDGHVHAVPAFAALRHLGLEQVRRAWVAGPSVGAGGVRRWPADQRCVGRRGRGYHRSLCGRLRHGARSGHEARRRRVEHLDRPGRRAPARGRGARLDPRHEPDPVRSPAPPLAAGAPPARGLGGHPPRVGPARGCRPPGLPALRGGHPAAALPAARRPGPAPSAVTALSVAGHVASNAGRPSRVRAAADAVRPPGRRPGRRYRRSGRSRSPRRGQRVRCRRSRAGGVRPERGLWSPRHPARPRPPAPRRAWPHRCRCVRLSSPGVGPGEAQRLRARHPGLRLLRPSVGGAALLRTTIRGCPLQSVSVNGRERRAGREQEGPTRPHRTSARPRRAVVLPLRRIRRPERTAGCAPPAR